MNDATFESPALPTKITDHIDPRKTLVRNYKAIISNMEKIDYHLALMHAIYTECNETAHAVTLEEIGKIQNIVHELLRSFRREM